jgi:hypothetical protein
MPTLETRIATDHQLVAAAMEEEEEDYEQAVVGRQPTWQETFQQLRDFHKLGRNKSPPPRLVKWMAAQRRRYKLYGVGRKKPVGIIKNRLNQLNSIGFDWSHGEETRNNRISDPLPSVSLPSSSLPIQQKSSRSSKASSKNNNVVMDKKKILNAGFPEQLFLMIQDGSKKCPHILDWHPDGSAFEIFDTKNVGNFISRYFRHGKVSSLRRMLHLYQFSTSNNVFRHPYFHRDMSLADLKRYVVKKPTP